MASVIVVDTELRDSVKEYAGIIDAVNQQTSFTEAVAAFFPTKGSNQISNPQGLVDALYKELTAEVFSKFQDKEYESSANLLVYLLIGISKDFKQVVGSPDAPIYKLLKQTVPTKQPSLRDRKALKPTTVISVLNTIFNLLPELSPTRLTVLEHIFDIIQLLNLDISLFEDNIGANLVQWLVNAQVPELDIIRVFWQFINLDIKYSLKLLRLVSEFSKKFTVGLPELHQIIKFAFASEVVDVLFLVTNNVSKAIAANKSDSLVALFDNYVNGKPVSGDVAPEVVAKSQIMQVAKFFLSNLGKVKYAYADIPVAKGDALEALLVQAIKAGVVEGKLDQVQQLFFLTRVNKFILAGNNHTQDWNEVKIALQQWKLALTQVNDVVKTTRENIVNANA